MGEERSEGRRCFGAGPPEWILQYAGRKPPRPTVAEARNQRSTGSGSNLSLVLVHHDNSISRLYLLISSNLAGRIHVHTHTSRLIACCLPHQRPPVRSATIPEVGYRSLTPLARRMESGEHADTFKVADVRSSLMATDRTCSMWFRAPRRFQKLRAERGLDDRPGANSGIYFHTAYQPRAGRRRIRSAD